LTTSQRLALVDREELRLSLSRQSELLNVSRSRLYYQPATSARDLSIMNIMDKIYTDCPTSGSRTMRTILKRDHGIVVGRRHIRTLMAKIDIAAIYPKKKIYLSQANKQHKVYPYLLRNLPIVRPNQVWSIDITYIKLEHGFCYLMAIIDWYSRYVIDWELSNTLDIDFCLRVLERAYLINTPEIFNSDQGSHFTSPKFTAISLTHNVKISMDGRGRCLDNIFIERLWRTVKQEDIYINHYESIPEVKAGLTKYFDRYNNYRPHQSLNDKTPAEIHFGENKKTAFFQQFANSHINLNTTPAKLTI
jgi:putative transposase